MNRFGILLAASIVLAWSANANVVVDDAKARATFALAQTGAAYMILSNQGDTADTLLSVTVPESVAAMVELHTVVMENDMMRMRELEDGIALIPGETVTLAPGGKHIMLMGLTGPLKAGESISMTLNFQYAQSQTLTVPIVKM